MHQGENVVTDPINCIGDRPGIFESRYEAIVHATEKFCEMLNAKLLGTNKFKASDFLLGV